MIRPTLERVWLCYLVTIALLAMLTSGGGAVGHAPGKLLAVHAVLLVAVLGVRAIAVRSPDAARVPRAVLACAGLPIAFSALCWLVPAVHPEPYEFLFARVDRALLGRDVAAFGEGMPALLVETLQLVYAGFYGFCVVAALGAARGSGRAAFDRAMLLLVGGFLVSYALYLVVPTLGPKVVLAYANELQGGWLAGRVRAAIDASESNPWDCFPSGHTMLTLTALLILWRWNRRWFWVVLLPALALVASTMLLRYHWFVDVAAGAALVWPTARFLDHLADRDGWPVAPAEPHRQTAAQPAAFRSA